MLEFVMWKDNDAIMNDSLRMRFSAVVLDDVIVLVTFIPLDAMTRE
jgi:hypothetical protein